MTVSSKLAALGVVVAIAAIAAYALLLRVAIVRNHPEGYVVAFALATAGGAGRGPGADAAMAGLAGARADEPPARRRRVVQLRRRARPRHPDGAASRRAAA